MQLVKQEIQKELENAGIKNPKIEKPPENIDADLSFPCFDLAKELKKSPVGIAKDFSTKLKPKYVKEVKPLGPYVNFHVDWGKYGEKILQDVLKKKEKYGSESIKENIIMDVYQANPFKSFHIGHIRNAVFGECARRLLEFTGRKITTVSYNGDVGVHVARWLWYYNKFFKGEYPSENFTKWAGQIYAESSKKVEENKDYEQEVNEINRKLDQRDKTLILEWKKFRQLCYDDFEKIAKELQVKVDRNIPESECEELGKEVVKKLFKDGKLVESSGAIGIDLKAQELGFFILLKSDGTALYSTKDFGLLQLKGKIGKFDKFLYVVGSEQELYFKQLFKVYGILGLSNVEHRHVSHGLVTLK